MRILALEPYYGGSHRSFIDGWIRHSTHEWDLLTLPARKWKWRMRHSALTFVEQVEVRRPAGESWEAVFCSDMLNLAEFRAIVSPEVGALPAIVYFHENQLTYPVRFPKERDYQFGMTNITSALAAREAWFNSAFHRDEFLDAIPRFLKAMPDHQPAEVVARIRERARVMYPAIEPIAPRSAVRAAGPLRIVWAARWEFDKAPEVLFEACERLAASGVDFRLSVLGEQFEEAPPVFAEARERLAARIDSWGYLETREDYVAALHSADVFVSTAIHEFFGLAAVEAIAAGAYPLVPERLAYPEVLELEGHPERRGHFYDGSAPELTRRLAELAAGVREARVDPGGTAEPLRQRMESFFWPEAAPRLDTALEAATDRKVEKGIG
jgi:glycosyltransferase involved in cell wall biosynthesis